ncbi:MAG: DNA alkylation repair protein [Gammaproteobacteria bacterium]|nr:DNA alkylation repair protein [Gammaproteobacteria bacterium]
MPRIPVAPKSIQKGIPLKHLLGTEAIECLAHNILLVYPQFDEALFRRVALEGLEPIGILERGQQLARALRQCLPDKYEAAIEILLASLTPPLTKTDDLGLAVFFYLPHVCFVAEYGLDPRGNGGHDPFEISMLAQYELTKRFSAEFSIRPFLIQQQERTLSRLLEWTSDPDPHVRRLCSEGARPRLPWAMRIPAFIVNPDPVLPILESLRNDQCLYVRRSVANHLGDIAKDHPGVVLATCERWLAEASTEMKWLIRHALRYPAKKGDAAALQLRAAAK